MSWIDDRIKQRDEAFRRSVLIEAAAEKIFNHLWEAITPLVEEAAKKEILVFTNGTPYERVIGLSVVPRHLQGSVEPKLLTLKLEKEKHAIMVLGMRQPIQLELDLAGGDVVYLKYDGKQVTIGEVATSILDAFLFPEVTKSPFS
jgi:hypothetical protein